MGDVAFADAFDHGQGLTYEDILAYALDKPGQPRPAPRQDTPTPLTRREQQVVHLVHPKG